MDQAWIGWMDGGRRTSDLNSWRNYLRGRTFKDFIGAYANDHASEEIGAALKSARSQLPEALRPQADKLALKYSKQAELFQTDAADVLDTVLAEVQVWGAEPEGEGSSDDLLLDVFLVVCFVLATVAKVVQEHTGTSATTDQVPQDRASAQGSTRGERFDVGLWDRWFGERITIEGTGPDGRPFERSVTKKWLDQTETAERITPVAGIEVHMLDAAKGYHVLSWIIGEHVSEETVDNFKDEETDAIYAMTSYKEGEPETAVLRKDVWDTLKRKLGQ